MIKRTHVRSGEKQITGGPKRLPIFLHIPKTAGTSVSGLFPNHTRVLRLLSHAETNDEVGLRIKKNHPQVTSLCGHATYHGIHEHWNMDPWYFCILRHPVAHMDSYYNYFQQEIRSSKSKLKTWQWQKIKNKIEGMGFQEFVEQYSNLQTGYLCSKLDKHQLAIEINIEENIQYNLDRAKQVLSVCDFVGVLEQDGIKRLADAVGKIVPGKKNVTKHKFYELTQRDKELVEKHGSLDMKLWHAILIQ